MRHAKSAWDTGVADHDRPLSDRGRREAPVTADQLVALGWVPDRVLASDSRRTEETWERMTGAFPAAVPVELTRSLYHADLDALAEQVAEVDDAVRTLLVLGHNPGWEEVVYELTGVDVALKTAYAALLEGDRPTWRDGMGPRRWRLVEVVRPR